jgi:hypothetical protein
MLYPCDCRDMKWIVDHHNRYSLIGDHWIETWKEIDRNKKETVIQNLGIKINYCPFCGKKVRVG